MATSEPTFHLGQRLCYDNALCTIRYIGPVTGTTGTWLGVEWDDPTRGKHSGSHKDTKYFSCFSNSPSAASFVRPSRPHQPAQSFLSAVLEKYTSEVDRETSTINAAQQIKIGTKTALEVGFDKIRRQLARVEELKIIIVDSYRVARVRDDGEKRVGEMVPAIRELDVGRNLIEEVGVVVDICRELTQLKSLKMGGNRFRNVLSDETLAASHEVFANIRELTLNENLMTWEEITTITSHFSSLITLNCGTNQLGPLPSLPLTSFTTTLTSLNLELNFFTALSDLAPLTNLTVLRNLHLKGNQISSIARPGEPIPLFSSSLQYLDVSYNDITSWAFVDHLLSSIPGLSSLRIAHNPIYDTTSSSGTGGSAHQGRAVAEESHMVTIGRLRQIRTLNFVGITADDRINAELFYLSRIAREVASVSEEDEATVLEGHPRWRELCNEYGTPDIVRKSEVDPDFLESRLVTVQFVQPDHDTMTAKRIPKSFDMYAVKGIAARIASASSMDLRLIWETGEWDPVAALDEADEMALLEEEEYSSDEEEAEVAREREGALGREMEETEARKMGRWVKREVELKDGTRQLGFCVDGTEVRVRIETKV